MSDNDKKNMVKARLLVLTKMFYELTDENHVMDTFEIIDYLTEHGVPPNEEVLMVMDLGYAAEGGVPLPNHTNRKPLDETVSYL